MVRVSVIMAAYNAENTIKRAIESISNQSFNDWELIICDDCSTDKTYEILEKYRKQDSRIKLLRNDKNMFSAYTRNKCIDIARGEFIVIQDSDDYSHQDRILESINYLMLNPDISFVSTSAFFFDDDRVWGERDLGDGLKYANDLVPGLCFVHAATTFKKDCILTVGKYREGHETRRGQDYDLFMRLYSQGFTGATISKKLYYIYETRHSYKRRKFRYRIDEAIIRYKGYKALKVGIFSYIFVLKPLIIGLVPNVFILRLKKFLANINK